MDLSMEIRFVEVWIPSFPLLFQEFQIKQRLSSDTALTQITPIDERLPQTYTLILHSVYVQQMFVEDYIQLKEVEFG